MMKKLFDDELSLSELKAMVKRLHKKDNFTYILVGALAVLAFLGIVAAVVMKLRSDGCCCCDDYDDDDFDDDDDDDDISDVSEKDFED